MAIECVPPEHSVSVIIDYFMMVIASICLAITSYGIYFYLKTYRKMTGKKRPQKALFITGLIFFIISWLTLFNALLYDLFFLFCPILDDWEGPIYHSIYFCQIYSLWLVLFTRLRHVFKDSVYRLSNISIISYYVVFISVAFAVVPMYIIFHLNAESFITLPYVSLSIIFSTILLIAFIYKLMNLFHDLNNTEQDQFAIRKLKNSKQGSALLAVMTKNTLLATISILCTFCVIGHLLYLYVSHKGFHEKHSILEEFILEFVILIDIVSNFLCILLSYQFFDPQYQKFCKCCNKGMNDCFNIEIEKQMSKRKLSSKISSASNVISLHIDHQQTLDSSHDNTEMRQDELTEFTNINNHHRSTVRKL
mmetsp:Transcript_42884/g.38109  ORF Transcript_42884/g.38109 Transcript_42884/m.38109 type:complete len:364 (-) Transcript_42884:137-1228(-)